MSDIDPVKYFETKLNAMSLAELQAYKKRLDERIQKMIIDTSPNEKIAPLIIYRGILEHEIKKRKKQKYST
jgi:hypothetical protein